jgi:ribosome-binding protein aMBF1 (putative translation factor)
MILSGPQGLERFDPCSQICEHLGRCRVLRSSSTRKACSGHSDMPKRLQSAALQQVYDEVVGRDAARQEAFEQDLVNVEAAQLLYDMRTKAGLSQRALAKRVGTTASVICRMEDAGYQGHTLGMLRRIAAALERRLELRAVPLTRRRPRQARGR